MCKTMYSLTHCDKVEIKIVFRNWVKDIYNRRTIIFSRKIVVKKDSDDESITFKMCVVLKIK